MRVFTHNRRSLWGLFRFSPGHTLGAEGRPRGHPQGRCLHENTVLSLPTQQTHPSGKVREFLSTAMSYAGELGWVATSRLTDPELGLWYPQIPLSPFSFPGPYPQYSTIDKRGWSLRRTRSLSLEPEVFTSCVTGL